MRMTGARDLRAEWAAVYGAAYVALRRDRAPTTGDERAEVALTAAEIADDAVKALHRVRGQEGE